MRTVCTDAAKAHLSRLLDDVAQGEEVVIARAGKPVARLVPLVDVKRQRRLGGLAGKIRIPEDFDAPLPEHILDNSRAVSGDRNTADPRPLLGTGSADWHSVTAPANAA